MQAKIPKKSRRTAAKETVNQPPEIELGWLGGTIGFNLRIAQEASVRAYLRSLANTGTLVWRFAILALIDLNPGLTQVALARTVRRDTSSLTSVMDDMCNRGLVTRIRPDHDRRSYALRITPRGVRVMNNLKENVRKHEQELDRMFTREQRSSLIKMLKQIASDLTLNA